MRAENEFQAITQKQGAFCKPVCSPQKKYEYFDMPQALKDYIEKNFASKDAWLVTREIEYKNTNYISKENQAILYHPSSQMKSFEIGCNVCFVTSKEKLPEPNISVIVNKVTKKFLPEFGVYECELTEELTCINMRSLAHFHPTYIVTLPQLKKSYLSLMYEPYLAE